VPLAGRLPDFEAAARFAKSVAAFFARRQPELYTARRGAANRRGRMYIDWQRNQQGATTVAAYSPRWRKGAPVSMPLAWSDLGTVDLRGAHFNLRNAHATFLERSDPWRESQPRQTLNAAQRREAERLAAA
jgi:bifunctional non-homologous end joining protein LigD